MSAYNLTDGEFFILCYAQDAEMHGVLCVKHPHVPCDFNQNCNV
jgi:hypothetical protein